MATFNNSTVTLGTSESDIYTASSKSLTLLLQAVNISGSAATCEIWLTDGSNVHKACLFPSQSVTAYQGVSDTAKHVVPSGYKIRGTAGTSNVIYVEVSVLEGMS